MKKKLLYLAIILLLSLNGFSQAIANPAPNIQQCGNEVFNLTVQTPIILGDQDPDLFTVLYYVTQADAAAGTNPITSPTNYVAPEQQTIFAKVTNTTDNSTAITLFTVSWNISVQIPYFEDFAVCLGSFELPPLDYGNYYTEPGGMGTMIPFGTLINETQTVYIFYSTDLCTAESSFTVSIIPPFEIGIPTDLPVCTENTDYIYVDLTQKIPEIVLNLENIFITFHETPQDAELNMNFILEANNYISSQLVPYTIWVRATNTETGCFKVTSFSVVAGGCTGNIISGYVSLDLDGNGCDVFEGAAPNMHISYIHNNTVYTTYTNADGYYQFSDVPDGINSVTANPTNVYSVSPGSYTFTMPAVEEDANFCIMAAEIINDISITVVPTNQARPGFNATYAILFQNLGTVVGNGTISLQYDATKLTFVSASTAMTQAGNTLILNYSNLLPFETKVISLNFLVMQPPVVNAQDVLVFTATADPLTGDANPTNNTSVLDQIVVNSYDPNDITVREGEFITEEQADEYLNYVVRFQNTGTADAINIKVTNTLDENLDWSTFQPITASHNYKTNRTTNEVEFLFDNIHLADNTNNEPESHGYLIYKIKPKTGIAIGDIMAAQAHIYFDFNPAIDTNIVTTTIQNVAGIKENTLGNLMIYPNPAAGKISLQLKDGSLTSSEVTIIDILGKTVLATTMQTSQKEIDISSLKSGVYFITVNNEGIKTTKKLIIK